VTAGGGSRSRAVLVTGASRGIGRAVAHLGKDLDEIAATTPWWP
jgi:NAD(P)-dependent dehydrogenase (short-subunit alcohol dehydrogenase family)